MVGKRTLTIWGVESFGAPDLECRVFVSCKSCRVHIRRVQHRSTFSSSG